MDWIDMRKLEVVEPELFASLTGPLLGFYYPMPYADEHLCRLVLSKSKLRGLWCSVYRKEEVDEQIRKYGGGILSVRCGHLANRLDVNGSDINAENYETLFQAQRQMWRRSKS